MRLFLLLLISLLTALPALAQTPPVPPSKKQRLEQYEKELKTESRRQKELEQNVREIEGDLKDTQKNLVNLSRSIQDNETRLRELEKRITEKEVEKLHLRQELEKDHQSISRLILALERIRRVPPEALIVKPGAPLKTAQSAMLMGDIIPSLYKEADNLKRNLETLDRLSRELEEEREKATGVTQSMKAEQAKLTTLIDRRQELYDKTSSDLEEQQKHVKQLSTQAKSLSDLVKKLEEDKKREATRQQGAKGIMAAVSRAMPGMLGGSQLPVSGFVKLRYNQKDNFGAPSKGIEIEGLGGALVVAPMSGTVRFAGPFKNYGNIVILEHDGGYHSLIAGLEKIDTVVGQTVAMGEPVGILHYATGSGNPVLYYELRLNGEAVDPARKLKGL